MNGRVTRNDRYREIPEETIFGIRGTVERHGLRQEKAKKERTRSSNPVQTGSSIAAEKPTGSFAIGSEKQAGSVRFLGLAFRG